MNNFFTQKLCNEYANKINKDEEKSDTITMQERLWENRSMHSIYRNEQT